MPDSRDKRRWYQFSLRELFLLALIVAAFFGGRQSMKPEIRETENRARRAEKEMTWLVGRNRGYLKQIFELASELESLKAEGSGTK